MILCFVWIWPFLFVHFFSELLYLRDRCFNSPSSHNSKDNLLEFYFVVCVFECFLVQDSKQEMIATEGTK